jgi:peptidoglycan/LPS O-acetylase OafA/YrhL
MSTAKPAPASASPDGHILFLDHLRGLAIFIVFIFHSLQQDFTASRAWSFPRSWGPLGVAIFFVISGFCIHLSHVRSREPGFGTFFIRRFFRIYPPYLVALLFFVLIFPGSRLDFHSGNDAANFLTHLFLVHNLNAPFIFGINGSFWSIAVEVQLYALYPLLLWLTRSWGWRNSLILLFVVEAGFTVFSTFFARFPAHQPAYLQWIAQAPLKFWFSWAIGAKIADDWLAKRPIWLSQFPLWVWPALFLTGCFVTGFHMFVFTFAALATATLIARLLSQPAAAARVATLPLGSHFRFAGLVSYSAYLLHEPLLVVVPGLVAWLISSPLSSSFIFLLCLLEWPLLLLLAWSFYRVIEMPSIQWGKGILRRSPPAF